MLLFTVLYGCATLPSSLAQVNLPGSLQQATNDVGEWMKKKFPGGKVRNVDRYCDALEEPSDTVGEPRRVGNFTPYRASLNIESPEDPMQKYPP
jgi:hypothetical protein